jgi:hypothetical protein
MRLRLAGGTARNETASHSPAVPEGPALLGRARKEWRTRTLARSAWCDHCEVRPRAGRTGGASRFCSTECSDAQAYANWSVW